MHSKNSINKGVHSNWLKDRFDISASKLCYHDAQMRTTLTIDSDVAVLLQRLQQKKAQSFKQVVNDALRLGAEKMLIDKPAERKQYTHPCDLGALLVPLDDISSVLAMLDEEKDRSILE